MLDAGAWIQLATAVAAAVGAVASYMARRHAKRGKELGYVIEDAVNHRHRYEDNGESAPRLFDIALENRRRLTANEFDHVSLFESIDRLERIVERHVEWEETEKYPSLEQRLSEEG